MPSFHGNAKKLAARFLQTVVFVDDRASYLGEMSELPSVLSVPGRAGADSIPSDGGIEAGPRRPGLDAKLVVDAFASKGLVCAVLRPTEGEDPLPGAVRAGMRSDILILDWDLNGDNRNSASDIICRILQRERKQGIRLRLVAIYAGQGDIEAIIGTIRSRLDDARLGPTDLDEDGCALTCGAARISGYIKDHVQFARAERRLTINDMPSRLIGDFASMTEGILSGVAVASLSAIRENTHKLLCRISPDLDPAYVAHRFMLSDPEDSKRQAVALISDELFSILQESQVGEVAALENIRLWLCTQRERGIALQNGFNLPPGVDEIDGVCKILTHGCESDDLEEPLRGQRNKPHKKDITAKFCCFPEKGSALEHEFAVLTTIQTAYLTPAPQLRLGQVVSQGSGGDKSFWLCIQPLCDSVRIAGERSFPFLSLSLSQEDRPFDLVVETAPQEFTRLRVGRKPYACRMITFNADTTVQAVVAKRCSRGCYFRDKDGARYKWVAELKPECAMSIVHSYAVEISRIGLDSSEWLRRWSRETG